MGRGDCRYARGTAVLEGENHSVEDITRHEADKVSTDTTIAYILDVIMESKENGHKSICFVTGVPGREIKIIYFPCELPLIGKATYAGRQFNNTRRFGHTHCL